MQNLLPKTKKQQKELIEKSEKGFIVMVLNSTYQNLMPTKKEAIFLAIGFVGGILVTQCGGTDKDFVEILQGSGVME